MPGASDAIRGARQTAGADFALATSQFLGKEVLEVSGFYLNTTKRPGSSGGAAFGASTHSSDPFISLVNRLQFDTVTRQLGWQSRFRWITRPGNDIFFVYTHNWTDRTTMETLDRKGSLKIVRTIRF